MNQDIKILNIIIVNYNTWDDTIECLESIQKSIYKKIRIFIVDNNSKNNSVNRIKNWVKNNKEYKLIDSNTDTIDDDFSNLDYLIEKIPITIFSSKLNLGFAKANNIYLMKFIEQEIDEFFLMLNPDTIVYPETINELMNSHNSNNLEIVGLRINDYSSSKLITMGGYIYSELTGSVKANINTANHDISYIHGGAVFLNYKTLKKAGILPTDYFLYFEDHDWCYNALQKNINLHVCSNAICRDKVGTSIGRGFMSQYYYTYNVLLFSKKYFRLKLFIVMFIQPLRVIYFYIIKKNSDAARGIMKGFYDFAIHGKRKIKNS